MNGPTDSAQIHIGGNVSGQVAIGQNVYLTRVEGGQVNQINGVVPIRAASRPVLIRPRRIPEPIGREAVVSETLRRLGTLPVQLHAGDGWGKSTVLKHVVYDASLDTWKDGVAFVSGFGLTIDDLEQSLFDAFFDSTPQVRVTQALVRRHLAAVESVIVIDDVEFGAQQLERLLDDVPQGAFVVSSRERTLTSGDVLAVRGLEANDAVRLFERAYGQALTPLETSSVERFGGVCQGQPQALMIAAGVARRGSLSIADLGAFTTVEELATKLRESLTPEELHALELLAAVAGSPLPEAALEHVLPFGEAREILERLRDDAVLLSASPRFWLPRQTAMWLRLDGGLVAERRELLLKGLADWSRHEPEARELVAAGPTLVRLAEEFAPSAPEVVVRLARGAHAGLAVTAHWGLWRRLLQAGLTSAQAMGDRFETGWALHELGTHALLVGDRKLAVTRLQEARNLRAQIGDEAGRRVTHHNLQLATGAGDPSPWRRVLRWVVAVAAIVLIGVLAIDPIRKLIDRIFGDDDAGELVLGVPEIDFGDVPTGETREAPMSVSNTGAAAVDVLDVRIEAPFAIDHNCGRLEPGTSCEVRVRFTAPSELGSFESELVVDHRATADADEPDTSTIPVRGASVERSSVSIEVAPLIVDFGVVDLADGLVPAIVTVANRGTAATEMSLGLEAGDQFSLTSTCAVLAPGDSCEATIGFAATAEPGQFSDVLHVEHTGEGSAIDVPISATIAAPPTTPPVVIAVVVDPDRLEFGAVPAGQVVEGAVVISNTGGAPTNVTAALRDGSTFAIAALDCTVLEPGQTCSATVKFGAVDPGDYTDVLGVQYSPGDGSLDVPLSATVFEVADLQALIRDARGASESADATQWIVPITVVINNIGGAGVEQEFRLTAEADSEGGPMMVPIGASAERLGGVFVQPPIEANSTTVLEIFVGLSSETFDIGQEVTIRVDADSCVGDQGFEVPPCRVVESDETNNRSPDFTFTIEEEVIVD